MWNDRLLVWNDWFLVWNDLLLQYVQSEWSRGMIPALGAGGPGFESRFRPHHWSFVTYTKQSKFCRSNFHTGRFYHFIFHEDIQLSWFMCSFRLMEDCNLQVSFIHTNDYFICWCWSQIELLWSWHLCIVSIHTIWWHIVNTQSSLVLWTFKTVMRNEP